MWSSFTTEDMLSKKSNISQYFSKKNVKKKKNLPERRSSSISTKICYVNMTSLIYFLPTDTSEDQGCVFLAT